MRKAFCCVFVALIGANSPFAQVAPQLGDDKGQAKKDQDDGKGGFQQPIEELFLTETLHPQEVGQFEIHLISNTDRKFKDFQALTSLEYGVTQRFQVAVASPNWIGNSRWSLGNSSASGIYALTSNNIPFASALEIEVGASDEEPGKARSVQGTPSLLIAHAFGLFQLHTQVGVNISTDSPGYFYAVAGMWDLHQWTPTLEFNDFVSSGQRARTITPGLYYHFTPKLELGFGAPVRVYRGADQPSLIGIVTYNF